jgi:hypothetical protein
VVFRTPVTPGNLIWDTTAANAIGFIGVATTTPGGWYGEKLTVDGSGLFDGDLRITGNATTSGVSRWYRFAGAGHGYLDFCG